MTTPLVELRQLHTRLGGQLLHQNLNLTLFKGERLALVGGSGSGKSVLLNIIALLLPATSGEVHLFGQNAASLSESGLQQIRRRMGIMFQQGALFSSMSLLENLMLPLRLQQKLPESLMRELAILKLQLTGLPASAASKFPQELSGGMLKRAAVARALMLDPELLLLDEPTAGLDPASASAFDELLLELHANMNLTLLMVTHDLDSLWHITSQVAFLGQKQVLCQAPMPELIRHPHPDIQHYFANTRAATAQQRYIRSHAP